MAKSLDEPSEVIVLVDGVEDQLRTRWLQRRRFLWTPIALAFQFLIISVYFGQGPGVMATLIVSPNAYANIPRAADLPQSSDEATVLQCKFREDWKTVAKVTYWIAGVIGVVFFAASVGMGVRAYRQAGSRWTPACIVLTGIWVIVLVATFQDAPNGTVVSKGFAGMNLFAR
ncbi:MAG: hypothetical protein IH944_10535 [Armatimonadetes bacterium]|nr:hypothetical protein [Armatimonadota bacterium]